MNRFARIMQALGWIGVALLTRRLVPGFSRARRHAAARAPLDSGARRRPALRPAAFLDRHLPAARRARPRRRSVRARAATGERSAPESADRARRFGSSARRTRRDRSPSPARSCCGGRVQSRMPSPDSSRSRFRSSRCSSNAARCWPMRRRCAPCRGAPGCRRTCPESPSAAPPDPPASGAAGILPPVRPDPSPPVVQLEEAAPAK